MRNTFATCSLAALALLGAPGLAWAAGCQTYSGTVNWTGPSSNLYINTPVWACVSDASGSCKSGGGYLDLENQSNGTVMWSSLAAGEPTFRPLAPHETLVRYMAIYRRPGEEIIADLQLQVCDPGVPNPGTGGGNGGGGTTPGTGGGNGGGGTTPPGTGGGGNPGSASLPQTYFIDLNSTFSNYNDWRYQGFTVSSDTTFDVRFAADYSAQAALIPASELSNFTNGSPFSGYALFDGRIGTKTSVTLGPGTYYAAMRNRASGSNTMRLEVDFSLSVSGSRFLGWDIGATEFVQPNGGRAWHSFSIAGGERYFVDGCNSGVETYIIPSSEIDNFTSGRQFRYYVDYSAVDDTSAPGLWEVALPPGSYWLVFRNQGSIAHSVTFQAERWTPAYGGYSTMAAPGERGTGRADAAVSEGLQSAWLDRAALVRLKFSQRIAGARLDPAMFRIMVGGTTLHAARAEYDAERGVVTLVVPELRNRTGSPSVTWSGLPTESRELLSGSTDPLPR